MTLHRNETIVGIIVFCALVLLFLGLMWMENQRFRGQGYMLRAQFEDVSGLNQGDPVTVSGLPIGRVHDMELSERGVSVSLWIAGKHLLPKGSLAMLKSQGVMGEKFVDILLGEGPGYLEPDESIPGLYQPDLNQVFTKMGDVGQDLEHILSAARSFVDDTTKRALRGSLSNMGAAAARLKEILDRNAHRLDETIGNLHALSTTLAEISPAENPEQLIPNVEMAARDLSETTKKLRRFSTSLDSLLKPTMRGESTLGKLLADETLYEESRLLVSHLDSLVQDLRRHPGRYFKVEIF